MKRIQENYIGNKDRKRKWSRNQPSFYH